jgi:NADH-quinone oxidoreductase subunit J
LHSGGAEGRRLILSFIFNELRTRRINMELLFFLVLAGICIAAAVNVLVQRQPIHAALSLIVAFISLAGIYIQMQAEFIAIMQIVVYTGAIMVLFVFVIMLLNVRPEQRAPEQVSLVKYLGIPLTFLLVTQVSLTIFNPFVNQNIQIDDSSSSLITSTQAIGRLLFTDYALPFELTSILLLVAIVGAILLAKKEL